MDIGCNSGGGRERRTWLHLTVLLCATGSGLLGGCVESIRQYTRFGGWTRSTEDPVVLSDNPARDAGAYTGGSRTLAEADWAVLVKYAPRPIWERLLAGKQDALRRQRARWASAPSSRPARPGPTTAPAVRDVPTVVQPDGKLQIFYPLHHYGGPKVTSTRDGTDRRKITTTAADLKPLLALVTAHLGDKGTVVALPAENKLVITCDPAVKDSVLKLLAKVDVPAGQVEITARIFEVGHDFDFQLGAQVLLKHLSADNTEAWLSKFSAKNFVDAVTNPVAGTIVDPGSAFRLIEVFQGAGITLDATFQALAEVGLITVVATPRMTVSAGQTAYILAGQELPIQSAKFINENFVSEKVSYRPTGVQLYITPQIVGPQDVKLHVVTMVSAVAGFGPSSLVDDVTAPTPVVNPIFDSREAETYVTVRDRHTLVIGGLRQVRTITREAKVPFLGDVQIMEWLFKNHRSKKVVSDLYFFVTPRLVK